MPHTVVLRKVGGSVMLALPPALLDVIDLAAGQRVAVSIDDGRIVVEPCRQPRYSLAELLARCDAEAPPPEDDREWLDAPSAGAEFI